MVVEAYKPQIIIYLRGDIMKKCKKCNTLNSGIRDYCEECGAKLAAYKNKSNNDSGEIRKLFLYMFDEVSIVLAGVIPACLCIIIGGTLFRYYNIDIESELTLVMLLIMLAVFVGGFSSYNARFTKLSEKISKIEQGLHFSKTK